MDALLDDVIKFQLDISNQGRVWKHVHEAVTTDTDREINSSISMREMTMTMFQTQPIYDYIKQQLPKIIQFKWVAEEVEIQNTSTRGKDLTHRERLPSEPGLLCFWVEAEASWHGDRPSQMSGVRLDWTDGQTERETSLKSVQQSKDNRVQDSMQSLTGEQMERNISEYHGIII